MSSINYKNALFYIVKTEEDFIKRKTTQLYKDYKDVRLLFIRYISEEENLIRFVANDKTIYQTDLKGFHERNEILTRFIINMN